MGGGNLRKVITKNERRERIGKKNASKRGEKGGNKLGGEVVLKM